MAKAIPPEPLAPEHLLKAKGGLADVVEHNREAYLAGESSFLILVKRQPFDHALCHVQAPADMLDKGLARALGQYRKLGGHGPPAACDQA